MILGMGLDLCSPLRLKRAASRRGQAFLDRVFSPAEQAYCLGQKDPWPSFAARWAAKEACFKAMSRAWKGGWEPAQVEVLKAKDGQPALSLCGSTRLPKGTQLFLSLTHERGMAAAVVVWEGN